MALRRRTHFFLCLLWGASTMVAAAQSERPGMIGERLPACPDTPNCVCSEDPGRSSFIEPLPIGGNAERAWARAKVAIQQAGGRIGQEQDGYLRATFTSRIFRFVDDLELRLDAVNGVIQVRSASRVGYSDFGVNRRRVENIRSRFQEVL